MCSGIGAKKRLFWVWTSILVMGVLGPFRSMGKVYRGICAVDSIEVRAGQFLDILTIFCGIFWVWEFTGFGLIWDRDRDWDWGWGRESEAGAVGRSWSGKG